MNISEIKNESDRMALEMLSEEQQEEIVGGEKNVTELSQEQCKKLAKAISKIPQEQCKKLSETVSKISQEQEKIVVKLNPHLIIAYGSPIPPMPTQLLPTLEPEDDTDL